MKVFISVVLLLITVVALYVSLAGWVNAELHAALKENKAGQVPRPVTYNEIEFVNEDALKRYEVALQAKKWFPWMVDMPQPVALLVTAMSFATVGGVIRVVADGTRGVKQLGPQSFATVFLAALTGLIVLGVSYIVPAALTISEGTVRPVALLFLCLVGGVFHDYVFEWLGKRIKKVFER
jgi:hypothetical protein